MMWYYSKAVLSFSFRNALVKATFYVCKAMQASLSGKADGQQSSLSHCERASSHLWNSLNMSSGISSTVLSNVRAISPKITHGLSWL